MMRVELLIAPGCSSQEETERKLQEILSDLAPEATFQTIMIDSQEKALAMKFPGSPTVRVNGKDVEPGADSFLQYGLG